jgi:hypothetical protein
MINLRQIAKELIEMAERDQKMRKSNTWNDKVDTENTKRMQQIIDQIGWPTISKVGKTASHDAWLLVQHADHNVLFQKRCLQLLRKIPIKEIRKSNIAYLEDRVRVNQGKKQVYGTQMYFDDKKKVYVPRPIEDPDNVDLRRKQMGLEKLEDYVKNHNKIFKKPIYFKQKEK